MYHITTKKAPGVISGTQTSENGPIEWSKHLPAHCQLKEGLKQLVTPLMAGLLEESQGRMWSFDKFFLEVQNILNKTVLHIFYVNRATSIEVYLEPEQTLVHLLEHILAQTDVPQASQLLLLDNELFATKVDANTSGKYEEVTIMANFASYLLTEAGDSPYLQHVAIHRPIRAIR